MPKISVIIPVYNVERYLPQCLNSVVGQTFQDIEIICVNDGSTDNSGKILEQYASKYCKIKVITKENQGASVARNTGLDIAAGDWISFVDSDDIVHPQMLEIAYKQAVLNNADFVEYKYKEFKTDRVYCDIINEKKIKSKEFDNSSLVTCRKQKFQNTFGPCSKLFSRKIVGEKRFIPHIRFEDYPFVYEVLSEKPRGVYLDAGLYFYRIREVSLSHVKADPQQIKDYRTGINHIFQVYEKPELKKEKLFLIRDFLPIVLKQQLGRCRRADDATKQSMFAEFGKELQDLNKKGLITWRGHKLSRFLAYKKLIKEQYDA